MGELNCHGRIAVKKRRFACGYLFLVTRLSLFQAFSWLLALLVVLGTGADIPLGFSIFAFVMLGLWIVPLIMVLLFWSFVVDPVERVVEIRRGRKRRYVSFDEISELEVPLEAQRLPRHAMLHLVGGETLMCPFVSQGVYFRLARLRAMAKYLRDLGIPVVFRSGRAIPPIPRFMRAQYRPKPPSV